MSEYVAFLRGINVGGNRKISMADLRAAFEELDVQAVRTVLNTGNVLFEAPSSIGLGERIEAHLAQKFGKAIGVILRKRALLATMAGTHPFGANVRDADTKFYLALLKNADAHKLALPCRDEGGFEVVGTTPTDIYAIAWRMPNGRFGEGLDKAFSQFGENITMRNWNTIEKILASTGGAK